MTTAELQVLEIREEAVDAILDDARALAFPRYPGTAGDQRAIDLVADGLREAGLDVAVEEFSYDIRPAFRALRSVLSGLAVLLAVSGFLATRSPAVAGVLLVAGLAVGGILIGWSPWSEHLYAQDGPTRTANVVGYRRSASPRLTIILLAHHDSKSQNLAFPVRMGLTILAIVGALVLTGWLAVALLGGSAGMAWLPAASAVVAAAALSVLATLRSDNRSPGGVDNAGSVGLLLWLAQHVPDELSDSVEWIFLSPGAEEDHMVGATRWLERHRGELRGRPIWAINFDGVGNPGDVALLERFGFGRWFSKHLSAVARSVAQELDIAVRGVLMPPAMGIDSIPFAHRGIDCLTIASGSLGRATMAIHSPHDVVDNLDRETLHRSVRLVAAMVESLARPVLSAQSRPIQLGKKI